MSKVFVSADSINHRPEIWKNSSVLNMDRIFIYFFNPVNQEQEIIFMSRIIWMSIRAFVDYAKLST